MTDPAKLFYRRSGPDIVKNGTTETPRVLMHTCNHPDCNDWGSFGIGSRWKDGVPGVFYCRTHLPAEEMLTWAKHAGVIGNGDTNANRNDAGADAGPSLGGAK